MAIIEIDNVSKSYGLHQVLSGLNLSVNKHEVVCLIGPSGCGKSTSLKCVNGLESVDAGRIEVLGIDVTSPTTDLTKMRSRVGMVFQSFNLFPHKTVLENVAMAQYRVLGRSRAESRERAHALLSRVGLAEHVRKYPSALSGGQQQRVAIARTLALDPSVLLLDEVTSALDPELVGEVLELLRELAHEGMTMILATHEMSFAREVASKVCFFADGRIYEEGPAAQLLADPERPKTQSFLRRLVAANRL